MQRKSQNKYQEKEDGNMLRVLQVIGKMDRAGAETMIMNLYRYMDKSKVQFDFMVFTDEEADYDQEIEELGGTIYHMPEFKGYNYFALCKKFKQFFKEHPYQIVHGHIGSLAPAYLRYAKKTGAFTIAHSHSTRTNDLKERILFNILSYPVRFIADFFLGCSKDAGIDRFGKKITNSFNFKIINNAIDCKKYVYSEERQVELKKKFGFESKTVVGHVGRFAPVKNHGFIIEVFKSICDECEDYVLLLVGAGEERTNIEQKVKECELIDKVFFMGVRNDIPDMMNLFDVFVFPSHYEGLGIVGVEAQAAGLPCFFSDGIPDEAIVTPNVWSYSLKDTPEKWKDEILQKIKGYERKDTHQLIMDAGYDIMCSAHELEKFYLEHSKQAK